MQHVDMGFILEFYFISFINNFAMLFFLLLVLPRKVTLRRAVLIAVLYSQLQPVADSVAACLIGGRYVEYTLLWYVVMKVITILEMLLPVLFIRQTIRTSWYKCYWMFMVGMMILMFPYVIYANYFFDTVSRSYYQYLPLRLDNLWVYLVTIVAIILITGLLVLLFRKIAISNLLEKVPNKAWAALNIVFLVMILITEKDYFDKDPGIEGLKNIRIFIVMFFLTIIFLIFVISFTERRILRLENQLLKKQNELQYESLLSKQENDLELQKLYLDIGNHLKTIQLLVEEGDDQKVSIYAEDVLHTYQSISPKKYSVNQIINAVLLEKMALCEELQISTELEVRLPEELAIRDIDLMCVLSNLLDNAIECCNRQQTGPRYIKLKATLQNQNCIFYVANSHDLDPSKAIGENGRTWKKDKRMHGYGQKIIKEITERYQGYMDVKLTQEEYQALVILK